MIARIFLDHPAKVDETFFEHMAFALKFSGLLFAAAGGLLEQTRDQRMHWCMR